MDNITKPLYIIKEKELVVLKQAQKELSKVPRSVILDVYGLFEDLVIGKKLSLPISRPLHSIAKGLHELRLSDRSGEFRVFYLIKVNDAIYVLHAAQKKKQEIDKKTVELLITRMRSIGL